MKHYNGIAASIVVLSQIVACVLFMFNGADYEKAMMPLFFAALMIIIYLLTDIDDKLKPV